MSLAAMTRLTEGLSQCTAHAENRKFSYLPCRHMNTNSVHGGKEIYFALDNINKK
jgi:hypothetical protein